LSPLVATLQIDVRLQWRNGFYWAAGFLLACWAVLVSQLPDLAWRPWLPVLVLGNLSLGTFLFVAGLVLLEKGEGTLEAQVVTPLSARAYLAARVASLTGLGVLEHFALVALVVGADFDALALLLGVVSGAAVYCLTGFVAVSRYDSIDAYLMPSTLWITALSLPMLDFAGLWTPPLMALHPLQPSLVLLRGAVEPLSANQWLFGLAGSALWIGALLELSRRAYWRFIARAPGTRG
jgi:fluoroquinolone transport system permease protein